MDYSIAICDDNNVDIDYIHNLVNAWSKVYEYTLDISTFTSAESFLFDYCKDKNYDILLLDIEMTGLDGVSLAKEVRKSNQTVQIIFVTGYSEYISEGYEVSALHYLMKPVNKDKVFEVLNRAVEKIKKNDKFLLVELSSEMVRIPLYEIKYLEVRQNYVTVHAKKEYSVKRTLSDFEKELDDRFYRMGRSYIVNLLCISRITKAEVILSDGTVIPLPRGQYEPINRAIILHT